MLSIILLTLFVLNVEGSDELSYDFYQQSCPQVEAIVRTSLQSLSLVDPTSPSSLLRLMFHDCQVQGCDASILVDPSNDTMASEMFSTRNFAIRNRKMICQIKSTLEAMCPQQVSCADIIILAARDAVAMSGGPEIRIPLGRRDSSAPPSNRLADALLPPANIGVDGMLRLLAGKGMTVEESVAILGAHTLGVTHCLNILSRLYKPDGVNANMEPGFGMVLRTTCPKESFAMNTTFVLNDPTTLIFDNNYFVNAMAGRGILTVDAELPIDPRTAPFVQRFAMDQNEFFRAFSSAFVKLSTSGVLTGNRGVIRKSCNLIR